MCGTAGGIGRRGFTGKEEIRRRSFCDHTRAGIKVSSPCRFLRTLLTCLISHSQKFFVRHKLAAHYRHIGKGTPWN
jgi:hypothetical protein